MKNYRFHRDGFFDNIVDMKDIKMIMTPSCLRCRARFNPVLFDLERPISKFGIRSGQIRS